MYLSEGGHETKQIVFIAHGLKLAFGLKSVFHSACP